MKIITHFLCLGTVALNIWMVHAQVVVTASKDVTLYQRSAGDQANGQDSIYVARTTLAEPIRRGLVFFDLSALIPPGSVVQAASLPLHVNRSAISGGNVNISLHKSLQNWTEGPANGGGSSGFAPASGDVTWLHSSFNSSTWSTPGGTFSPTASATSPVGGIGSYTWTSSTLMS